MISGWLSGQELACKARDAGDADWIPGSGRSPWRRKWQPTLVFLPGESHGWRSLAGYSPWGRKESDTPERHHFTSQKRESKYSPLPSFPEESKKAGAKWEAALRVHAEQSCGVPSSFHTKEPGLHPHWAETCLSRTGPPQTDAMHLSREG